MLNHLKQPFLAPKPITEELAKGSKQSNQLGNLKEPAIDTKQPNQLAKSSSPSLYLTHSTLKPEKVISELTVLIEELETHVGEIVKYAQQGRSALPLSSQIKEQFQLAFNSTFKGISLDSYAEKILLTTNDIFSKFIKKVAEYETLKNIKAYDTLLANCKIKNKINNLCSHINDAPIQVLASKYLSTKESLAKNLSNIQNDILRACDFTFGLSEDLKKSISTSKNKK